MYVCVPRACLGPAEEDEGIDYPRPGTTDSSEPPRGAENLCPLKEQPVLLTMELNPSPVIFIFKIKICSN